MRTRTEYVDVQSDDQNPQGNIDEERGDKNTRPGRKFLLANPQLDSGQAEIERAIIAFIQGNQ